MRALLAQLAPIPAELGANASRCAEIVRREDGVDLVVFPELFVSGYELGALDRLACLPGDPPLASIAAAAADSETVVIVGFAERLDEGIANSLACFDSDGQLAGVYRKTHLFDAEADAFVPGDHLVVVPLAGRRVAPLICFDVEFPEPARAVADFGADLLVTASANMAPFYSEHRIATQARALENQLPHLYVNRVGAEGGFEFVGGTRAIDADGRITSRTVTAAEELLITEVGPAAGSDGRIAYLKQAGGNLPVRGPMPVNSRGEDS